jgi:hypothetical protein
MNDLPSSFSRLLYRFDCPEPHVLGEYQLDVLDTAQRVQVARHAMECEECTAELTTLREFLAVDPPMPQTFGERLRRVVASLVTPPPGFALGGVRGVADLQTREFTADDVSISVGPGAERGSFVGLVTGADTTGAVRLVSDGVERATATLDELGNFELSGIPAGTYTLELDLGGRVIVLENLQID